MFPQQLIASIVIGVFLLLLIIRLVQRGRLDILYSWVWLGIGVGIVLVVVRYDWLVDIARLMGAVTPTTALFLLGFVIVLLMCLQFSLAISAHRRQIRKLTQHIAMLERTVPGPALPGSANDHAASPAPPP